MDKYQQFYLKVRLAQKAAAKAAEKKEADQMEAERALRATINQNAQEAKKREASRKANRESQLKAAREHERRMIAAQRAAEAEQRAIEKFSARMNAIVSNIAWLFGIIALVCFGYSVGAVACLFTLVVSSVAAGAVVAFAVYAVRLVLKEKERRG